MRFVVPAPPVPSLAVHGVAGRFPLRRIFCVGRNYAAHAREMGGDPDREPPFFFTKPADAAFDAGADVDAEVAVPPQTEDFHHEVELAVALAAGGEGVTPEEAGALVYGCGVAIDLTRRDLQAAAKKAGRPWDMSKGFDRSAPVAPLHPVGDGAAPAQGRIWLEVDGETRQDADLAHMVWSVPEIIAHLSRLVSLAAGDLILTGTPAGVGPLVAGQRVRAGVEGLSELSLRVR